MLNVRVLMSIGCTGVGYARLCMSDVSGNISKLSTNDSVSATPSAGDSMTATHGQDADLVPLYILIFVGCVILLVLMAVLMIIITRRCHQKG